MAYLLPVIASWGSTWHMRITTAQSRIIRDRVRQHLGNSAGIWLFGSRLREDKRGGDVDLYVESGPHALVSEIRCKIELQELLDLPVDLVVRPPGDDSAIATIAKNEGVRL